MSRPPINEIRHFVPPPAQLRLARELLAWSTTAASEKAGLTVDQVAQLESDPAGGPGLFAYEDALRAAGAELQSFAGPSGQIWKTRLGSGPWLHFTRRGPLSQLKDKIDVD